MPYTCKLAIIATLAVLAISAQNVGPDKVNVNSLDSNAGRDATQRRSRWALFPHAGGAVVTYAQSHAIYMNPVSAAFPNGSCPIANC